MQKYLAFAPDSPSNMARHFQSLHTNLTKMQTENKLVYLGQYSSWHPAITSNIILQLREPFSYRKKMTKNKNVTLCSAYEWLLHQIVMTVLLKLCLYLVYNNNYYKPWYIGKLTYLDTNHSILKWQPLKSSPLLSRSFISWKTSFIQATSSSWPSFPKKNKLLIIKQQMRLKGIV